MESSCLDCRNYAPLDVVKGICHPKKITVLADDATCDDYALMPRCKHCEKYTPSDQEALGFCEASPSRPMTYPALITVTCENFAWKAA